MTAAAHIVSQAAVFSFQISRLPRFSALALLHCNGPTVSRKATKTEPQQTLNPLDRANYHVRFQPDM